MNHQYPETGTEFVKQHGDRLLAKANESRLAARSKEVPSNPSRSAVPVSRKLAIAVAVVLLAGLVFATIALAGAAAGGGGGGGWYLLM